MTNLYYVSTPCRIWTYHHQLRRLLLYPSELRMLFFFLQPEHPINFTSITDKSVTSHTSFSYKSSICNQTFLILQTFLTDKSSICTGKSECKHQIEDLLGMFGMFGMYGYKPWLTRHHQTSHTILRIVQVTNIPVLSSLLTRLTNLRFVTVGDVRRFVWSLYGMIVSQVMLDDFYGMIHFLHPERM